MEGVEGRPQSQDVAVRVLLSVNNPGADGTTLQHRSVKSRRTARPSGRSLRHVARQSEPSAGPEERRIAERAAGSAGQVAPFLVGDIRAVRFDGRLEEIIGAPFFQAVMPGLGRGVNLGCALESPKEGAWGVVLKEEYFPQIKAAGFDSVRIPICWSAHAADSPLIASIEILRPRGMGYPSGAPAAADPRSQHAPLRGHVPGPRAHRERFLALWQQIAEHYRKYPPALVLELLNEPQANLTAEKWNRLLAETITIVRRSNPNARSWSARSAGTASTTWPAWSCPRTTGT